MQQLPYAGLCFMKFPFIATCLASAIFALTSCGIQKATTAPKQPTKFLASTGTDMSKRVARLPFEHSWRDPKVDPLKYKNIVVRPVTTTFLRSDAWQESKSSFIPSKRTYQRRCSALARSWDKSLAKSFSNPLCLYYKTTSSSQANTIILEIALTEVRFAQPVVGKKGTKPTPSTSLGSVLTGIPICAFEARARDASTGKLLSTIADRRAPEITLVDSGKNTFTRPNEAICAEWSDQLMKSPNIELFPRVRRSWFGLY